MDAHPPAPTGSTPEPRRRALILGVLAVVVAVIALLVVGLLNRGAQGFPLRILPESERPAAPSLSLPLLSDDPTLGTSGTLVELAAFRGRPVILNFWFSDCDPCRDEAPALRELQIAKPKDVLLLGVNVRDLTEDARAFMVRYRLNYPSVRDRDDRAYRDYRLTGYPETFVIDRAGRLAAHISGPIDGPEQARLLARALVAVT